MKEKKIICCRKEDLTQNEMKERLEMLQGLPHFIVHGEDDLFYTVDNPPDIINIKVENDSHSNSSVTKNDVFNYFIIGWNMFWIGIMIGSFL